MCCPALPAVEISVMADEKIYCQSVGQGLHCTSSTTLEYRILYYCVRRNQLVSWVLSPRLSRAPNGTRPNPIWCEHIETDSSGVYKHIDTDSSPRVQRIHVCVQWTSVPSIRRHSGIEGLSQTVSPMGHQSHASYGSNRWMSNDCMKHVS